MNELEKAIFDFFRKPNAFIKTVVIVLLFLALILSFSAFYIVQPGHRGVLVTLGRVSPDFKNEGLGIKLPIVSKLIQVPIRQITVQSSAESYSSDLQQINLGLAVLYRIPQESVVRLYREYSSNIFQALIEPRVIEAVKEAVAIESAERIVQKREEIKRRALDLAREKITGLLVIEDLVIRDISLSAELEQAIEQKMVQEQEAAKARFTQQKAEIEAQTAIIQARGEAEAINIRGRAIRQNPSIIELQIVEKWNGISPLVVGGGKGANILLPIKGKE